MHAGKNMGIMTSQKKPTAERGRGPRAIAPEASARPPLTHRLAVGVLRARQYSTTLRCPLRTLLPQPCRLRLHPPPTSTPATRNRRASPQPHGLAWLGQLAQAGTPPPRAPAPALAAGRRTGPLLLEGCPGPGPLPL